MPALVRLRCLSGSGALTRRRVFRDHHARDPPGSRSTGKAGGNGLGREVARFPRTGSAGWRAIGVARIAALIIGRPL
jgi:hypothetical protein